MAAVKVVSYQPGDSALHRLDPRTKQIMVMVLSSACFAGGRWFLSMLTISIALCAIESRIGLIRLIREIRYFLVFLLFVFIIRALTFNDGLLPVLVVSQVQAALLFCWRLLLIVLMAVLLISTTPTGAIRAALVWMLRPLPLVNERAAATMVGLIVRMVPLILFQAGEISDAMRSRCIEARKSPLFRMNRFTIMLFRRAIIRGDDLVDAMQARCYNEQRTMRVMQFTKLDAVAAGIGMLVLATLSLA